MNVVVFYLWGFKEGSLPPREMTWSTGTREHPLATFTTLPVLEWEASHHVLQYNVFSDYFWFRLVPTTVHRNDEREVS